MTNHADDEQMDPNAYLSTAARADTAQSDEDRWAWDEDDMPDGDPGDSIPDDDDAPDGQYDPSAHRVDEVQAHLTELAQTPAGSDEFDRIVEAERAGKARKGITEFEVGTTDDDAPAMPTGDAEPLL